MDKKNTLIGAVLLTAAFATLYFSPRSGPNPPAPAIGPQPPPSPAASSTDPAILASAAGAPAAAAALAITHPNSAFAAIAGESRSANITTLGNSFIEVRFTDFGGAIRDVALKKYPAELGGTDPFVFNALHADPLLAFVDFPGLDRSVRFERVSATSNEVVYRAVLDQRLEVTRRYVIAADAVDKTDPYQIRHETTFRNLTDQTATPVRVALSLGTAAPTNPKDPGLQLTTGHSTGDDQVFVTRGDLESSSGFLGIGAHSAKPAVTSAGAIVWTSVQNQFFSSILTPDEVGSGMTTRRVKLLPGLSDEDHNAYGITGVSHFDVKAVAARSEAKLTGNLYVGPKEYRRLANSSVFKVDQDKVMHFGFFKYFSQILLTLMTWIHGWAPNWGIAIILTTLTLKTIFIPFTLAASKSAKRMAKLQPEMALIREKFKDSPPKQQAATMELFKKHRVNPVGGCLPILLTIPFFMGFFQMLQSTAELRFAPFLWAPDLSAPDTVAVILGLPLNIMPLLMGATMVVQMQLTPSPSVDNAQMKMMKFMPIIFTFFCYNFSCALSLYSFVNGLFTIGQQLVINRMKDPVDVPATVVPGGKPVKNVTPTKKRLK